MSATLLAAVPIESCSGEGIVHPNAPLELEPWGSRQLAVTDGNGNLLTFFEFPEDS